MNKILSMARYLNSADAREALEQIISGAEHKLILVSPSLSLSSRLFNRIHKAAVKGVHVRIIYRKNEARKEDMDRLKSLKNIDVKFSDDLNASCYLNENEALITSLDLRQAARSWDVTVKIKLTEDKDLFDRLRRDVENLYALAHSHNNPGHESDIKTIISSGYCIRCSTRIRFDFNKPFCGYCQESWSIWLNEDYPEVYCHFSGEQSFGKTSKAHPVLKKNLKKAGELNHF